MKSAVETPLRPSSLEAFQAQHVRPKAGRTLIVGSQIYRDKEDRRLRYADALGIDMLAGPGVDRVLDMEEPLPDDLGQFEHIECLSVLEHSRRPWLLAANIERCLLSGGTLFVAVPFAWRIHAYPNDYWRMTPEGVRALFPGIQWHAIMLGAERLHEGPKLPVRKLPHPHIPRTEVLAFGSRA